MNRIPAVDPEAAEGKAADLLTAVRKALGVTPNLFRVAAHAPAALGGLLGLSGALAGGALPAKTREAIAIAVAEANGCDYCLSAHAYLGRSAGLDEIGIAAARRGEAEDPKTAAALAFARAVVAARGHVSDADVALARLAGLRDGDLVEIVANVAVNVFTNYLNSVAGTEIDFPVLTTASAA
ncbi:MAG: carboxymuconolactone decarboxylase family protein [Phyllobacteriaceae bacterium]|nr:carboxymuconolactone decarboxylase family protein [Phyllobacteriaceae bacterium]